MPQTACAHCMRQSQPPRICEYPLERAAQPVQHRCARRASAARPGFGGRAIDAGATGRAAAGGGVTCARREQRAGCSGIQVFRTLAHQMAVGSGESDVRAGGMSGRAGCSAGRVFRCSGVQVFRQTSAGALGGGRLRAGATGMRGIRAGSGMSGACARGVSLTLRRPHIEQARACAGALATAGAGGRESAVPRPLLRAVLY